MDHLSFRLANRIVGNPEGAAGLEITVSGPTLQFNQATEIALTGAEFPATLNGESISRGVPVSVEKGDVLKIGLARGGVAGIRQNQSLTVGRRFEIANSVE